MKSLKLIATLAFVALTFANCKTAGKSNLASDKLTNEDKKVEHACATDLGTEGNDKG